MSRPVTAEGLEGQELPSIWVNYANVALGPGIVRIALGDIIGESLNMRAVVVMPHERARALAEVLISMLDKYEAAEKQDGLTFTGTAQNG